MCWLRHVKHRVTEERPMRVRYITYTAVQRQLQPAEQNTLPYKCKLDGAVELACAVLAARTTYSKCIRAHDAVPGSNGRGRVSRHRT